VKSVARMLLLPSLLVVVAGCAHRGPYEEAHDPLEPVNRVVYRFNDKLDRYVLKPVAQRYRDYVPVPVRKGVRNFFSNLGEPLTLVNNVLQAKPQAAASDFMRFTFNSVFGLAGVFDVASGWGLPRHHEDFGQTFAVWGFGEGWYLVLPLLGPSNVRDAVGLPFNWQLDPALYTGTRTRYSALVLRTISVRADLLSASRILDTAALDPYVSIREAYRQKRWSDEYDGNPPEPDFFDEELSD